MTVTASIVKLITERLGLAMRPLWLRELPVAVDDLCRGLAVDPGELGLRLRRDPELLEELASRLTVGETHFMRHPSHFDFLTTFLAEHLETRAHAFVWSAGCSTGEEPYSVVMALADREPRIAERVEVLATDLTPASIEKARLGVYGPWSFRQTPEAVIERHFRASDDETDRFSLDRAIIGRVRSRCEAIDVTIAGLAPASCSAILFRNVAIYLSQRARARIYRNFAELLVEDGLLLVAPTDPRPPAELFETLDDASTSIYRRIDPNRIQPLRTRPRVAPPVTKSMRPLPVPSVEPPVSSLDPFAAARHLGDRGEVEGAIALVTRRLDTDPADATAYLVRGELHLAGGDLGDAVKDLRSATFLAPEHCLARFWYASALSGAGRSERALRQLEDLEGRLAHRTDSAVLEDGETTGAELREAVALAKEAFQ